VGESAPRWKRGLLATWGLLDDYGAWKFASAPISCGVDSQVSSTDFAGAIKIFVQEQLPQIQYFHPDVEVQLWSVQIDHIHIVMVIPPKYAVSSIVGKMKVNLSRQLRLRYPD
jgi:hypothetical protein